MSEDRRKHDEEIIGLLRDLREDQVNIVVPALKEISGLKKTVYGNGSVGLCEEVREIKRRVDYIPKIIGWVVSGIAIAFTTYEYLKK